MWRRIVSAFLFASLSAACEAAAPCVPSVDAAVQDAGVEVRDDAGVDAIVAFTDGGLQTCSPLQPTVLGPGGFWRAVSASETIEACGSHHRAHVFRAGDGTPVVVSEPGRFGCGSPLPDALPPGEYEVAIEDELDPSWVIGAALIRPESCPPGVTPSPPYCAPIRVRLDGCGERRLTVVLHCDPNVGPCPASEWPWLVDSR